MDHWQKATYKSGFLENKVWIAPRFVSAAKDVQMAIEIPAIRPAGYKLLIIRGICIFMFS